MSNKEKKWRFREGVMTKSFFPMQLYYILLVLYSTKKGSTSHVIYSLLGGEALSRAEPPAGRPEFTLSFAEVDFSKISIIFATMPGPILRYNFFKNA